MLEARIGCSFTDQALLETALTHRSAGAPHNERLEFLGDAIIGFHIAERLYARFPAAREGNLTRLRATLVRRETLATMARELDLGRYLVLGSGALKSGGRNRDSILADVFEAVVGAVFLDLGEQHCREWLDSLYFSRLELAAEGPVSKDFKTRLQEKLQARGLPLPEYQVVAEHGTDHEPRFTVECRLPSYRMSTTGIGGSRRRAEQEAARHALDQVDRQQ